MKFSSRAKRFVTTAVAVASMSSGLALAGLTSAGAAVTKLDVPLGPQDYPSYIWPYASGVYFTVTNMNQFQALMYRPLYWVGKGSDTTIQTDLSTGALPVWASDSKSLTITMKGWKFSNGETVDARSVVFFLNMYMAAPGGYAGYVGGMGIPDQISSATASGNVVTIELTDAVNHNWFLYNFLTEISPMPRAWDRLSASAAAGSAGCGANLSAYTRSAARAVCGVNANPRANPPRLASGLFKALNDRSKDLTTYTSTDPYWSVVNGPWKLSSFDTSGAGNTPIVFVPNATYGGPQKAQVNQLVMHPYASTDAEKTALATGQLDSGYVLPTDLNTAPKPGVGGTIKWSALLGKFKVRSGPSWSFDYAYYNFDSGTGGSPLVKQLYIRQALQTALDQVTIIKSLLNGYGVPTYGPIPALPKNDFAGANFKNPYPYSLTRAKQYLTDNGWTVPKTGTATCTRNAGCGTGIPKNTALDLHYYYVSSSPTTVRVMDAEKALWAKIGVNMILVPEQDPNAVADTCFGGGSWEICQYGGWLYAPDYYPSGELLFYTNALSNPGFYSDAQMDTIIDATTTGSEALKTRYAAYAAAQVPYMYQPTHLGAGVISTKVKGVLPVSPVGAYLPEYLHK